MRKNQADEENEQPEKKSTQDKDKHPEEMNIGAIVEIKPKPWYGKKRRSYVNEDDRTTRTEHLTEEYQVRNGTYWRFSNRRYPLGSVPNDYMSNEELQILRDHKEDPATQEHMTRHAESRWRADSFTPTNSISPKSYSISGFVTRTVTLEEFLREPATQNTPAGTEPTQWECGCIYNLNTISDDPHNDIVQEYGPEEYENHRKYIETHKCIRCDIYE